jgi:peptidoglycan/LPS O-acetylase OafA/YrhL
MRLTALDGWRGIACLLVALYHLPAQHALYSEPWLQKCAPVLELFFLISGFVISLAFTDTINGIRGACAFIVRMIGRMWPVHLVTLSLLVALACVKTIAADHGGFQGAMRADALLPQIFLVQTWVGDGLSWNFPSWTLSAELAAYLSFAALLVLVKDKNARLVGAGLLAVGAGLVFLSELGPREHYNVISVARCLTGFFIGFMLRELWQRFPIQTAGTSNVLEIVAVIAVLWTMTAGLDGPAYFINYLIFGLVVFVFANGRGVVSRALNVSPIQWLGKVSFSIYMIHALVRVGFEQTAWAVEKFTSREIFAWVESEHFVAPQRLISLDAPWANDLVLAAYGAIVLAAAAVLYHYVEGPTRAYSARLAVRIRGGGAPAAAEVPETDPRLARR